jgi:hypothetical protein
MATTSVKLVEVEVNLPWVKGKWIADTAQRDAAWEIYVELVTRIAIQPLGPSEGLMREALSSLYALFLETRRVLKAYGPKVATRLDKAELSFGEIAVAVLNQHLRPLLSKWHPLLQAHEALRGPNTPPLAHELAWDRADQLRQELEALRGPLTKYADLLAKVCGISSSLATPLR